MRTGSAALRSINRAKLPRSVGGPGVRNQTNVGGCEGCANSSGGTIQLALDGTPLPEPISHVGTYLGALMCDAVPNADGSLPWFIDTGTMPSSILGGWGLYGGSLESAWGQLPMSQSTMYSTDPSAPQGALIQPTPNQLYTGRACRLQGAYFLTSSGAALVRDLIRVLGSGKVLTNAIRGSSAAFQNYTGGIIGALDGPIDHAQLVLDYEWTSDQASLDAFMAGDDSKVGFFLLRGCNSWGGKNCPDGGTWGEVDEVNQLGGQYRANNDFVQQAADWCVLSIERLAA